MGINSALKLVQSAPSLIHLPVIANHALQVALNALVLYLALFVRVLTLSIKTSATSPVPLKHPTL